MANDLDTCWTMVHRAADGDGAACSVFAHSYLGIVKAFLAKRWRNSPTIANLDDAVQEVFLDFFRAGGALARLDPDRVTNFRTFLFGVAHKVALRHEERLAGERRRGKTTLPEPNQVPAGEDTMSRAFDREWARQVVQRARARQQAIADAGDDLARRRVDLLDLRFGDGKPIREIAVEWSVDAAQLHREYAKAREEFKQALRAEVAFHHTGNPAAIEGECKNLLSLLE